MRISYTRRFAEALGSWMHFEACCFRAGLFSESSLKTAIGSVASSLRANHEAARVHADYPLTAIQRVHNPGQKSARGRKRSVDFALIFNGKDQPSFPPELLIEAKWAGSSHCSVTNIMADFIRLSLMKRAHPTATCLLVLGGHSKDVRNVLLRKPFEGGSRDRIHCDGTGTIRKFKILPNNAGHLSDFAKAIREFHAANLDVPVSFSTSSSGLYPKSPATFQAIAWEVRGVEQGNVSREAWAVAKKADELIADSVV